MNRRNFLKAVAVTGATTALAGTTAQGAKSLPAPPFNGTAIPDDGWHLWVDSQARWEDDTLYLPHEVDLARLPVHAPTCGWETLSGQNAPESVQVTLPATVEQMFWGKWGSRPYEPVEYRYAADDPVPQNGAYRGVSWWSRSLEIPAAMKGKRLLLHIRAARMRAEVYLNQRLVGYSIMEELPFTCDLTSAAQPGGENQLAIRITNPGGRYDWVDGTTIAWGKVNLYRSHGFGGLDRGLTLEAVPMRGHIQDSWVFNNPDPRVVTTFAQLAGERSGRTRFEVLDGRTGKIVATAEAGSATGAAEGVVSRQFRVPDAQLWDLKTPVLYRMRTTHTYPSGEKTTRVVAFGFRWFAPQGLGEDAIFRLNGRRIKLYTSISWGFWGLNGLWPTPELAEKEVTQAKRLGLNCLNFHRNVGKEELFEAHDRLGLLRYMEPGGGKLSIGRLPTGAVSNAAGIVMEKPTNEADLFSQRFMLEKCIAMVRAFRSHPSLIQYTLQNEIGANLENPDTFTAIQAMHREDPSRSVVLNDGFSPPPRNAAQAWFAPYDGTMHRSDREPWAAWWNNHQGAGDQWYDDFYRSADSFTYRQPLRTALVEFGEMEGCAVADNHALMVRQIEDKTYAPLAVSYDLRDHREIDAAYARFFERWGFREAFPTQDSFYRALGDKCYASWQQYMENIRICDAVDFAAISGWESTAMENHSGIVDNLRNFKGDPDLIASSLLPLRPVAKQHALCYGVGERAVFDLYLLNETGTTPSGKLRLQMIAPDKSKTEVGSWAVPAVTHDQFSYTVAEAFASPALALEGIYKFRFVCDGAPEADFTREIWIAHTALRPQRPLRIGVSGVMPSVRKQLLKLKDTSVSEFSEHEHYDLIAVSGVVEGTRLDRQIGDETGLEAQPASHAEKPAQKPGKLDTAVLASAAAGTPLLVMAPDDFLSDGIARQLAGRGCFTYNGQVGDTRAPWMGNWLFVREHATFAGLKTNHVLGVHYQAHGKQSNGLLVERVHGAPDPEIIMAYSRDHDRQIGAASFLCRMGQTPVLFHRAPAFSAPLQQRWLCNAVSHLTGVAFR